MPPPPPPPPRASIKKTIPPPPSSSSCCCPVEAALDAECNTPHPTAAIIRIVDAVKTSEGSGSPPYTAYVISYAGRDLRRRYSEFSSLRSLLRSAYPAIIVPPIPEKHSLACYATNPARAKQDPRIIDLRKRMLESFVNRLLTHPVLRTSHLFHRFLEPGVTWNDVVRTATLFPPHLLLSNDTTLLALRAPSSSSPASSTTSEPHTSTTANLSSAINLRLRGTATPKNTPAEFLEAEAYALKFESHFKSILERSHRRVMKRYTELAQDYADLAATYNVLSLHEAPLVASAVERLGACLDYQHIVTNSLSSWLEEHVSEPLHEYAQFCDELKAVLRYRNDKQLELEQARDSLEAKRVTLAQLERAEHESMRIAEALRLDSAMLAAAAPPEVVPQAMMYPQKTQKTQTLAPQPPPPPPGVPIPPPTQNIALLPSFAPSDASAGGLLPPTTNATATAAASKRGFVESISVRINAMMDSDPDTTRRHNIAKTRDAIASLEELCRRLTDAMVNVNSELSVDLSRFHRRKTKDVVKMLRNYAHVQKEYCERNLREWEETRREFEKIEAPTLLATPMLRAPAASGSSSSSSQPGSVK